MSNFDWDKQEDAAAAPEATSTQGPKSFDWDDHPDAEHPGFHASPLETGVLHATNLFGLGDEAIGAAHALGAAPGAIAKSGLSRETLKKIADTYRRERDTARDAFDAASKENPKSAVAGDIAQALVPMGGLAKGATWGAKAARGTAMGAAYGLGNSKADLTSGKLSDAGNAALDTAVSAGGGAALANVPARTLVGLGLGAWAGKKDLEEGNGGTAALKALGGAAVGQFAPNIARAAGSLAGTVGRYGYSSTFGVSPEAIRDYLLRSKEINASPSKEAVKGEIDNVVAGLRDKMLTAKESVRDKTFDVRQGARDAVSKAETTLENARSQKQLDVSDKVEEALQTLKDEAIKGSQRAKDVIKSAVDEEGIPDVGAIPVAGVARQMNKQMRKLAPLGRGEGEAGAAPGADSASLAKLQAWKDWLGKLPQNLTYDQAKPVIQRFDRATKDFYGAPPGTFAPEEQMAVARARQYLDMKLKQGLPDYADAMTPVREDTRLLSDATKNLGSGRSLISRLGGLERAPNAPTAETLDALGQRLGQDFRGQLGTPTEDAALGAAKASAQPKAIAGAIGSSPEAQSLAGASGDFAKVRGAQNSEALIDRMLRGKEVQVDPKLRDQEIVGNVSSHYPELPQHLENLKTLNSFTGDRTNGSRNTLRFGALGLATGAYLGRGIGGATVGATAGAQVGSLLDKYGPRIAKTGLDATIGAKDRAQAVIGKLTQTPGAQHYAKSLSDALEKGSTSYAARYYLMQKTSPEFRAALGKEDQ